MNGNFGSRLETSKFVSDGVGAGILARGLNAIIRATLHPKTTGPSNCSAGQLAFGGSLDPSNEAIIKVLYCGRFIPSACELQILPLNSL